jgi:hypothetical protein
MNAFLISLVICVGSTGKYCDDVQVYDVSVSKDVYTTLCIQEPVTYAQWSVLDEYLEDIAPEVGTPVFFIDSIDCLGEGQASDNKQEGKSND